MMLLPHGDPQALGSPCLFSRRSLAVSPPVILARAGPSACFCGLDREEDGLVFLSKVLTQSVPDSSGPGLGLSLGRDTSDMVLGPGVVSRVAHELGLVHLLIWKLEVIGRRFSLPHSFCFVVIHKYFVGERSHPSSDFAVTPGGTHARVPATSSGSQSVTHHSVAEMPTVGCGGTLARCLSPSTSRFPA